MSSTGLITLKFIGSREANREASSLLPEYATLHSAGCDLKLQPLEEGHPKHSQLIRYWDEATYQYSFEPGDRVALPTGVFLDVVVPLEPPYSLHLDVRPRSGNSLKGQYEVLLGTIDIDYADEIMIMVHCLKPCKLSPGTKLAQLVGVLGFKLAGDIESKGDKRNGGFGSTD